MFYTPQSIKSIANQLRHDGKRLVLATGFFDLLHQEHINFLTKAKLAGDILIVGVESDLRAQQVKGEGRPVESQKIRCTKVALYADYVVALSDDFNNYQSYDSLMAVIKPSVYAVSSHTSYLQTKQELTEKYGGKLQVVHEFNPDISTTQILNRQNQL